jgi:LPS export ABC transporter protein LptC
VRRWLVCVAAAAALSACNPKAPVAAPSPSGSQSASPGAKGLDLHITGEGTAKNPVRFVEREADNRIEYELLADRAESAGKSGDAHVVFKNARITFHDKNGSTMTAAAPEAVIDQRASTLTLQGGVTARAGNGMTLTCRELQYNHADQMLHGIGNVVIIDPKGFRGTGSRFDSDISLTHYRMQ